MDALCKVGTEPLIGEDINMAVQDGFELLTQGDHIQ